MSKFSKEQRRQAAVSLSESEGLSNAEAEELVNAIMEGEDFSELPPEHRGDVAVDENVPSQQYDPGDQEVMQEQQLEDEFAHNQMGMDVARENGDQSSYRNFYRGAKAAAHKLKALRSKKARKKRALDQDNTPYNPQELDDPAFREKEEALYELQDGQERDTEPEVLSQAVDKATRLLEEQGTQPTKEEIEKIVPFYTGKMPTARAYAIVANADGPMVCPKCRSKVSRQENPHYFKCARGHVSELNLKRANPAMDMGLEDSPMPEDPMPQGPVPEGEGSESESLSQEERNRLNGVLYQVQEQAGTPMYILGAVDGFFDTSKYEDICLSQDEISEYQAGKREGKVSRGGSANDMQL